MRQLRGFATLGALLLVTAAHAGDVSASSTQNMVGAAVPASRAEIESELLSYYGGETTSARWIGALGIVAIGSGAYLVTRDTDFSRAAGWPLLGLGLLEAVGGVSYSFYVDDEIAHYRGLLAKDPARFREAEIAHIRGTARRFVYYRLGELGLAVAGAAALTYGAIGDDETAKGLGTGLISVGLPFFIMDTINDNRAVHYLERLTSFRPAVGLRIGEHGFALAIGGSF